MKLCELHSPAGVVELEKQLDALMYPLGLDVKFSKHFIERILTREREVSVREVVNAFLKLKSKYKKKLLKAKKINDYQAILKDFSQDLNIVFAIRGNQLTNITIKQKNVNSFKSNNVNDEELKV